MIHCCSLFLKNLYYFYMDYWKSGLMLRFDFTHNTRKFQPTNRNRAKERLLNWGWKQNLDKS